MGKDVQFVMDWEQLFQRWDAALSAYQMALSSLDGSQSAMPSPSPLLDAGKKEAQAALERRVVPDIAWLLKALKGRTAVDKRRRHFIRIALRNSSRMPEVLFLPMLRAAVYEPDPSFNKLFLIPCLRLSGPRKVNEVLIDYFENGTDREKAGAASAFYWSLGLRARDGIPDENIDDLIARVRQHSLMEYVKNEDVRVRQRLLPQLKLKKELYPEELHPLIDQAIQLSREHLDEYIRHRIEIQLGSGGLLMPVPD